MQIHTKVRNIFTGRSIFLYGLLILVTACNTGADKIGENSNADSVLTQTEPQENFVDDVEVVPNIAVAVIPEQDPKGIYWGVRDTVTGKLVVDYTFERIWDFKQGFALAMRNSQFGLIDRTGKVVIQPDYGYPRYRLQCGVIAFEDESGPIFIFDTTGKLIRPMIYSLAGFLPCQQRIGIASGVINFQGDTILPFTFKSTRLLPEGVCIVSIRDKIGDDLFGLYDLNGKQILPHVYKRMGEFHSGRSIVTKDGKYGVIDVTGKELFYTEYNYIESYDNGYAIVRKKQKNGLEQMGIIDRAGREVVPAIYEATNYFSEGMAAVIQNRKYGFVDAKGKIVIPFKYDQVESFQDGIAKVWVGWKHCGYINKKGEEIIPPDFEAMDQANLRRYFNKYIIGLKDSICHVFDYSGKEITALTYEITGIFNEEQKTFYVRKNNKTGIIDSNFQVKIPVEYDYLEEIFPGRIVATKKNKFGFLNNEGKVIAAFEYDGISPVEGAYMDQYQNRLAQVSIKGKVGLMNGYGYLVIPIKYQEIEDFSHGLAVVKRNNKYGFVNDKGVEIIPAIYDKASAFDGSSAEVTLKGKTFLIDIKGNEVIEDCC